MAYQTEKIPCRPASTFGISDRNLPNAPKTHQIFRSIYGRCILFICFFFCTCRIERLRWKTIRFGIYLDRKTKNDHSIVAIFTLMIFLCLLFLVEELNTNLSRLVVCIQFNYNWNENGYQTSSQACSHISTHIWPFVAIAFFQCFSFPFSSSLCKWPCTVNQCTHSDLFSLLLHHRIIFNSKANLFNNYYVREKAENIVYLIVSLVKRARVFGSGSMQQQAVVAAPAPSHLDIISLWCWIYQPFVSQHDAIRWEVFRLDVIMLMSHHSILIWTL